MAKNQEQQYLEKDKEKEFEEKVVSINRITKVVKGGRRFRFSATVIVGNKDGKVGYGMGKAKEIPDAIRKAIDQAKGSLITIPITNSKTVPHDALGISGSGRVYVKPASDGTGVVAGGAVRTIFELAGVSNILAKSLGTATPINVIRATFDALGKLRTLKDVAKLRGKKVEEIV